MTRSYFRNADVALLVVDLNDISSLKNVDYWLKEIKESIEDPVIVLVGTKYDLMNGSAD